MVNYDYENMKISILQQTKYGQKISGDNYFIHETETYSIVAIVDGLGSGPHAREAADKAIATFTRYHYLDGQQLLRMCNEALRGTRGAVIGSLRIDHTTSSAAFVGIGNIQCLMITPQRQIVRALSRPGYLNGRAIDIGRQVFQIEEETVFLMFSDGLELNRSLLKQFVDFETPAALIANIFKTLDAHKDDVTVVAGQYCPTT